MKRKSVTVGKAKATRSISAESPEAIRADVYDAMAEVMDWLKWSVLSGTLEVVIKFPGDRPKSLKKRRERIE